jgi:hypothetical protein
LTRSPRRGPFPVSAGTEPAMFPRPEPPAHRNIFWQPRTGPRNRKSPTSSGSEHDGSTIASDRRTHGTGNQRGPPVATCTVAAPATRPRRTALARPRERGPRNRSTRASRTDYTSRSSVGDHGQS